MRPKYQQGRSLSSEGQPPPSYAAWQARVQEREVGSNFCLLRIRIPLRSGLKRVVVLRALAIIVA